MYKTQLSSGWKLFIVGGCAVVALCGASILALLFLSVLTSPAPQPTAYVEAPLSGEGVSPQEPDPGVVSVSDVLTGHRWRVHSPTLGDGVIIEADFKEDGSFDGIITFPPDEFLRPAQQINGKWYIVRSLLYLEWDWIQLSNPSHEQIPMEISNLSQDNLQAVDKWWRLWEFERID